MLRVGTCQKWDDLCAAAHRRDDQTVLHAVYDGVYKAHEEEQSHLIIQRTKSALHIVQAHTEDAYSPDDRCRRTGKRASHRRAHHRQESTPEPVHATELLSDAIRDRCKAAAGRLAGLRAAEVCVVRTIADGCTIYVLALMKTIAAYGAAPSC